MSVPLRLSCAARCACPGRAGRRSSGLLRRSLWMLVVWSTGLATAPAAAQPADRALALSDTAYVDLGDPGDAFDLVPGGELTFALWIRHLQPELHAKIFAKFSARDAYGFATYVFQFNGTFGGWVDHNAQFDPFDGMAGTHVVGDRTWHHIALVQRDTLLLAYVDGRLDWTLGIARTLGGLANDRGLWLGWNGNETVRFVGEMDEMSVWHRALSRREIRRLMYGRPDVDDPDLVAYWSFDEDDPRQVRDYSGNGYHGRLFGPAIRTPARRPAAPPFRDTIWFYGLAGLAALAGLYGLMRLYAFRLARQRRRLEHLVAERTAEVERQKAQLERQAGQLQEIDRAKSRFFANLSHEFRTPLTLSIGPLDDLLAGREGPVPDHVQARLGSVLRNNRRLLRLVNQLLDLARLEAHALTLHARPVDLTAYLDALAGAFADLAARRGIAFERSLPGHAVTAWADPDQLELVVTNLLSNAFKFTPDGGRIRLALDADGPAARLAVRDTGPGIAAEHLPRLFDRFYRTDDAHTVEGTGIGLALVKEVAELHGGAVAVESTPGFGAVFTVTLPLGKAHLAGRPDVKVSDDALVVAARTGSPPAGPAEAPAPAGSAPTDAAEDRTTVLVVDDNPEVRAYVVRHLRAAYRIEEAADGAEALEKARARTPDLVLADVMMPRLDGLGLLAALRADPELSFVPVVLLTARAAEADRLGGLSAGADDYLTKPFSAEELRLRVRNLLARQQRLREKLSAESEPHPPGGARLSAPEDGFVERARAVVEARMAEEGFGVEALADALAMERTTLFRRLRESAGETPTDFVRRLRLERAAALLARGAGTVGEIAFGVGFQSTSYFNQRFREHFGTTPTQYEAQHRGTNG